MNSSVQHFRSHVPKCTNLREREEERKREREREREEGGGRESSGHNTPMGNHH